MHFRAPFHLRNPHIQTILPLLFSQNYPNTITETFSFKDGDFTEIVWSADPYGKVYTKVCVLFHGLEGSIQSHYIQGMMKALSQEGYLCVLMHFRNCGSQTNNALRTYHAGEIEDAGELIQALQERFESAKLYAIGYSLGGNMLLKRLAAYGLDSPIYRAVSVSAPIELGQCTHYINTGLSKIYQTYLLKSLKKTLLTKAEHSDFDSSLSLKKEAIKNIKTIYEYDDIYTSKVNGFKDANEYYTRNSAKQFLKEIQTPTLLIHAKDDPFMPPSILPEQTEVSSFVELLISENGGHVGFIEGSLLKPKFWLEKRVKVYFDA